jgi:hypothetical protein
VTQLARDVPVKPGGTLARLTFGRGITETGFEMDAEADASVAAVRRAFGLLSDTKGPLARALG